MLLHDLCYSKQLDFSHLVYCFPCIFSQITQPHIHYETIVFPNMQTYMFKSIYIVKCVQYKPAHMHMHPTTAKQIPPIFSQN